MSMIVLTRSNVEKVRMKMNMQRSESRNHVMNGEKGVVRNVEER